MSTNTINIVVDYASLVNSIHENMASYGIYCNTNIAIDGNIHRFANRGKGDKNCWYVFHDGYGAFGDWSKGDGAIGWSFKGERDFSHEERAQFKIKMAEARVARDNELQVAQEQAAILAQTLFDNSSDSGYSKYLDAKRVQPHGIHYAVESILVPMVDVAGKIWSVQTIFDNGQKRFMAGGRKKGCFHVMGEFPDGETVYICEGYSTGATVHEATGFPTIIAFDAGNLISVVAAIRGEYPELKIIIAGDDDKYPDSDGVINNPGRNKAESAAAEFNCTTIFPIFKDDSTKPTDFNDLHALHGLEEVKGQLLGFTNVTPVIHNISNNDIFPQHLLDNIPGLPGLIAKWINETSLYYQPILALSAAIAISGTLYSHKIRSESNLRTNFLMLGIARSGIGKDHARKCAKALFTHLNLSRYICNKFASDAGLLNKLENTSGIILSLMDEIGRELKTLTAKGAGSHESRMLTVMMELFSSADGIFDGKSYASKENNITLNQPCLNIYGTTTPKRFYESLNSDDAIDGLLARWLIFETKDIDPIEQDNDGITNVPREILDAINFIDPVLSFNSDFELKPEPRIVRFSDTARDMLKEFRNTCRLNRLAEIKSGGELDALWARTAEHAIKLALVSHPFRHGVIESTTMQWACDLSIYLTHVAIKAVRENVTNSEYEKNMNKVFDVVKSYNMKNDEAIRHGGVYNAVRTIKQRDCDEILKHLVQSGRIEQQENEYKGRITYKYKAL
ncbi:Archaeal primase DnaG/twinkle, TOPRIM domain [uncultured Caudovirales phage]|uniref:Archaeal primase DnaG/twinkle, TOPRIM domain n=1 Tax=uncultured Caudovirales phage TaxID=2100421 RepID=A0A6J5SIY4_9CAUD|nr:Archaeal primase DnaG/twinkle, TOPRIM domain [uncultured Caudovirales phage]